MTGRMIHHAGWFVALGPLIPLPLILFLPRVISVDELLNHLPEVLSLTWGIGFLPALLTGIFMAILTGHADCAWYYRMLAGGIAGPLITAICCGIIGAFIPMFFYLIPLLLISALPSGIVMGLLIPWLPPRIARHQQSSSRRRQSFSNCRRSLSSWR
ncbi:TPA: hypothetical protein ACPYWN_002713 [Klebsiella oxytoca]